MLARAVVRADVNAAVLGAERKHLERVLEARQLGRQTNIECVAIDGIDFVPRISAHQKRTAVDQTSHPIVVALDRGFETDDAVLIRQVYGIDRKVLRLETIEFSGGDV